MKRTAAVVCAGVVAATAGIALAGGTLSGKFSTRITGAPSRQFNGVWTVSFGKGGRYTISEGKRTLVTGRATFKAPTITFGHETGPAACRGPQATGVYNWRLKGKTLLFELLSDTCSGRRFVLIHKFTKVA